MKNFKLVRNEDGLVIAVKAVMGDLEMEVAEFDPPVSEDNALMKCNIKTENLLDYVAPEVVAPERVSTSSGVSSARKIMLSKGLRILPKYDPTLRCTFGKHKGSQSQEIPSDYKKWLVEEVLAGKFEVNSFIIFCFVLNCFHALKLDVNLLTK